MNNIKNKENTKPANDGNKVMDPIRHRTTKLSHNAHLVSKRGKKDDLGISGKTNGSLMKPQQGQEELKARPTGQLSKGNRQTLSKVFLSQQAVLQKKLVAEIAKPLVTAPCKPVLGTYKGQVVQAKVNSFRKQPDGNNEAETRVAKRPSAAKVDTHKPGNLSRPRAMSTTAVPLRSSTARASSALPPRPKSVSHRPLAAAALKPGASKAQQATTSSEALPAKPVTAAAAKPVSSKAPRTLNQKEPLFDSKPRPPVGTATDRKAQRSSVASTKSQYRVTVETAEDRRTKLAEWLAAKGKTLKRPPISSAPPVTSRATCKLQPKPKPKSVPEPQVAMAQPEMDGKLAAKSGFDSIPEPKRALSPIPDVMNTTLDLLNNSETDLPVDPEVRMDELVMNLCDAMEAMEVPSTSAMDSDDHKNGQMNSKGTNHVDKVKVKDEADSLEKEVNRDDDKDRLSKGSISAGKRVKIKMEEECRSVEETECFGSPLEEASVVRYSVRTTPYLQSVGKLIQEEAVPGSVGRRQSAIKELKFLTPVRRSSRIQRQSARLPTMLAEHDPCVTSLAELARLDGGDSSSSAYVYRRNPALLHQPGEGAGAL